VLREVLVGREVVKTQLPHIEGRRTAGEERQSREQRSQPGNAGADVGQDAVEVGQAERDQDAGEADDDPGLRVQRIESALLGVELALDLIAKQRQRGESGHDL
jgi:hypothetical protein